MGLIAKYRTKARTAAAQYPTNLSTDWAGSGMPHMAAIVRTAACSVAERGDLRSSGFRGRDTLGIGSAMRSGESTIWVEQAGFVDWTLALGLETVKGPALDWALNFHAIRGPRVSVSITTPAVLTRDGSQIHKHEYLEARELVVAGLTASAPPANESILDPLLIGTRVPRRGESLASVVSTACSTVPAVGITRKRLEGRKAVAVPHTREVVSWHDNNSAGYKVTARCIDRAHDETPSQAFGRWVWEVGLLSFLEGDAPALVAADQESFRADVTRFKLRNQGVLAAQQLTLFRSLMADGLRELDLAAALHGAQHG
jgi:hypothetical protein